METKLVSVLFIYLWSGVEFVALLRHLSNAFDYTYDYSVCVATYGIIPQKFDFITVVVYKCIRKDSRQIGATRVSSAYLGFI